MLITCEYSWHQSREHQEQHAEEQKASVVECFLSIVANVQIQKSNKYANNNVRCKTEPRQRLQLKNIIECLYDPQVSLMLLYVQQSRVCINC